MTAFCNFYASRGKPTVTAAYARHGAAAVALARRRSSTAAAAADICAPTYRNNFNETETGIEGVLLNTLLNPLIIKLMNRQHELHSPENLAS